MKKKVALLLALSMVLSTLPMNVFGNTGFSHPTSVQTSGWHTFWLEVPLSLIDGVNIGPSGQDALVQFTDTGSFPSAPSQTAVPGDATATSSHWLMPIMFEGASFFDSNVGGLGGRRLLATQPTGAITTFNAIIPMTQAVADYHDPQKMIVNGVNVGRTGLPTTGAQGTGNPPAPGPSQLRPNGLSNTVGVRGFVSYMMSRGVADGPNPVWDLTSYADVDRIAGNSASGRPEPLRPSVVGSWPVDTVLGSASVNGDIHYAETNGTLRANPTDNTVPSVISTVSDSSAAMGGWRQVLTVGANVQNFISPRDQGYIARFVPMYDRAANAWSNTHGWIDLSHIMAANPSNGFSFTVDSDNGRNSIRIPITVNVTDPNATVSLFRGGVTREPWAGATVIDNAPLRGTPTDPDATLPGTGVTVDVTPVTFTNALLMNPLVIRETAFDRIRNMGWTTNQGSQFPVGQSLNVRYESLANRALLRDPNTGTSISAVGIARWVQNSTVVPLTNNTTALDYAFIAGSNGKTYERIRVDNGVVTVLGTVSITNGVLVTEVPNTPGGIPATDEWGNATGLIDWAPNVIPWVSMASDDRSDDRFNNFERVSQAMPGIVDDQLGWFTLRLQAQRGYNWRTDPTYDSAPAGTDTRAHRTTITNVTGFNAFREVPWTTGGGSPLAALNRQGTSINHGNNFFLAWEKDNDGFDVHVLYVRINAGDGEANSLGTVNSGARQHFQQIAQIQVNSLLLFPTMQALPTGDVSIVIQRGFSSRLGNPTNTFFRPGPNDTLGFDAGVFEGLVTEWTRLVGVRTTAELQFNVIGEPATVWTGRLGNIVVGATGGSNPQGNPANSRNGLHVTHYRGVRTAQVELVETVAGIWTSNWSNPIEFTFGPGIQILGATINAGTNANNNNIINNFQGWIGAHEDTFPAHHANVQMSPDILSLAIPVQSAELITTPVRLTVTFDLSIDSNYEHKYGTNEIAVNVSGVGVSALAAGSNRQVIAVANDPITVNLPGGITQVQTAEMFRASGVEVSDAVVTINDPNVLLQGSEIWFYFAGREGAFTDLNIMPTMQANYDASTGLMLSQPFILNHPHPSFNRRTVAFTVNRQPHPGLNPFDITFTNITADGLVEPGVEYNLVVSGTRIAQNEQSIRVAIDGRDNNTQPGLGGALMALNAGTFTTQPYATPAVEYSSGSPVTDPGLITEIPPFPSIPEPARELRLWEGMGPFRDIPSVPEPFIWEHVGPNRVGFVSLRVFVEELVQGEAHWDDETSTATITGTNSLGTQVSIAVQSGNTNATIQVANEPAQTVDIATYVGFNSGPAGSVSVVNRNSNVFLPLRFVSEAFGYTVELVGNVVIFR